MSPELQPKSGSSLAGPTNVPAFEKELDRLVALARQGHKPGATFNNPSEEWLISQMHVLQDLPEAEQQKLLSEASVIDKDAAEANAAGRAAGRAWPEVVVRLNTGGYAFFSQLGVVRRPDRIGGALHRVRIRVSPRKQVPNHTSIRLGSLPDTTNTLNK